MVDDALFLINLLQFDFVFIKPCDTLDNIVDGVIRHFEEEEIVLMDLVFQKNNYYVYLADCSIIYVLYMCLFYFIGSRGREA